MLDECNHQWDEEELISDDFDPSLPYGHRQTAEYQLKCIKCGEIYERSNPEE
jgi:hypothetical protein